MSAAAAPPHDAGSNTTGIILALVGNALISLSLTITKHAHNINQSSPMPSIDYTRMPVWWLGMATMALGELGNFSAYGFAPASLVSPMGAVTIIFNAILASSFLGETMRRRDKVGAVFTTVGGVVLVIFAPSDADGVSVKQLVADLSSPLFIVFMILLIVAVGILIYYSPQFGKQYVLVYIMICSLLGAITVLCVKAVSNFLRLLFAGQNNFNSPLAWILIIVGACSGVLQIRYLNKAMENFGATEVVPVYYVTFTLMCIVGAAVLYKEFAGIEFSRIVGFIAGCIVTFLGVYMITGDRDRDDAAGDVKMDNLEHDDEEAELMGDHRVHKRKSRDGGDDDDDDEMEDGGKRDWDEQVSGLKL